MLSSRLAFVLLCALALQGCDLPRDPNGTLERVRGSQMRVGVVAHETQADAATAALVAQDRASIESFARSLGAVPQWRHDSAEALYRALERGEIDLVGGGVDCETPWSKRLALSKRIGNFPGDNDTQRCFAAPAGENGFLLALNRFIGSQITSGRP